MEEEAPDKLIACYGTLKKGGYNHRALGRDAEFMGVSSVRGVMYWNGSYPKLYSIEESFTQPSDFIKSNEGKERDHAIEVYRVNDQCAAYIRLMEKQAGYVEWTITTEWGPAIIYYMPHTSFDPNDEWIAEYTN